MSVVVFTETPGFVYRERLEKKTLITPMESGKEKRRRKWPAGKGKRRYSLNFKTLPQSGKDYIENFFDARDGAFDDFYWKNPNDFDENQPITETLNSNYQAEDTSQFFHYPLIPDTQVVYDDATPLTEGVDYSVNDTTGFLTWIIKPANGSVVTADLFFYRVVRYVDDSIDIDRIAGKGVYNISFSVIETEPRY